MEHVHHSLHFRKVAETIGGEGMFDADMFGG